MSTDNSAPDQLQRLVNHGQDLMKTAEGLVECLGRTQRALHETLEEAARLAGASTNNRDQFVARSGGIDKD